MARIRTKPTTGKRSLMLALSEIEMGALDRLATKRGLTKSGVLRQALRLYESIEDRLGRGEKLYVEDTKKKTKSELMLV